MMQQGVASAVAGRDQLIGVRAMAALTGQAPSTVTRYVQRHPELGAMVDGQTKVWRGLYLAHKDDNPIAEAPQLTEDAPAERAAFHPAPDQPGRQAKARYEESRAELAELELAERKGELVKVADVQRMVADAAQRLRDELLSPQIDFAERLKAADTPQAAAAMLVARNRAILQAFADRLAAGPAD